MGKGIDLARLTNPEHVAAVENLKEQLLIVFLKRLGGKVTVPVAEVDDTGRDNLALRFDQETKVFEFEILRTP